MAVGCSVDPCSAEHVIRLLSRATSTARRAAIEAVLSEWFRTMGDLPIILRQAVEMGLFSSQQLVRFCRMDNRPGVARTVARTLPTSVSALAPFPLCPFRVLLVLIAS